ncbi:hypothetical protein [Blastococcus sp. TF02A-26]|uniref:hypothetical protein n=1 Tax=Blastococcus sp. TF02A-26 TaxID=2250577 RepID=UPI000DE91A7E|nr:hypothetical protein [Blastococcus sp. TF02A-26]RBY84679.1 hypothetical protein DQ240_13600 [Blastococcus sp. TF02A-26]
MRPLLGSRLDEGPDADVTDGTDAPGGAVSGGAVSGDAVSGGTVRRRALRERAVVLAAPVLLVVLQAVITVLRVGQVRDGYGTRNLEASYHVLLTVESLLRNPLSESWGLPTLTLGAPNDKWIGWGAAVATEHGDFVYTSFPPAGFWLPTLLAAVRGGELGLAGLVALNGVLAAICGVLLYALVTRAVVRMERSIGLARFAGVCAALLYLLSPEALQSHGAVYWPHSLLQPVLLGQLVLLERLLLPGTSDASRRRLLWGLGVLTAVGCYTEWTAFVFALGTGALVLAVPALRRRARAAGVVLVAVGLGTAVVLATHYVLALGLGDAVEAWSGRFVDRAGSGATYQHLLLGYAQSFGGALLAVLVIVALAAYWPADRGRRDAVGPVLVAASLVAVAENVILLQHASQFTFDRLKFGIPLALLAGLTIARLTRAGILVAGIAVGVAGVLGIAGDRSEATFYGAWPGAVRTNEDMVDRIRGVIDLECATIGSDLGVRAYVNLLLDRGVHETVTPAELERIAGDEDSCGTVHLELEYLYADLPLIATATVVPAGGEPVRLAAPGY